MISVDGFRQQMSAFQRELLDQITDAYLATNKGSVARVLHMKYTKGEVMDALRGLGGSTVFECEDHTTGNRYQPTFLGLLLCTKGPAYEALLARYLEYVEALVRADPERTEIKSAEVELALQLTPEDSGTLYNLLLAAHVFGQFSSSGGDGRNWQARVLNEVDDLPGWKSKQAFVQHLAARYHDPKAPVFLAERRAYHFGEPQAVPGRLEPLSGLPGIPPEPEEHVERWKKKLLSYKLVAAVVLGFIVLSAVLGGLSSIRDFFE